MAGIGIHDNIIKPLRKMITSVNKYLRSSVDILPAGIALGGGGGGAEQCGWRIS